MTKFIGLVLALGFLGASCSEENLISNRKESKTSDKEQKTPLGESFDLESGASANFCAEAVGANIYTVSRDGEPRNTRCQNRKQLWGNIQEERLNYQAYCESLGGSFFFKGNFVYCEGPSFARRSAFNNFLDHVRCEKEARNNLDVAKQKDFSIWTVERDPNNSKRINCEISILDQQGLPTIQQYIAEIPKEFGQNANFKDVFGHLMCKTNIASSADTYILKLPQQTENGVAHNTRCGFYVEEQNNCEDLYESSQGDLLCIGPPVVPGLYPEAYFSDLGEQTCQDHSNSFNWNNGAYEFESIELKDGYFTCNYSGNLVLNATLLTDLCHNPNDNIADLGGTVTTNTAASFTCSVDFP